MSLEAFKAVRFRLDFQERGSVPYAEASMKRALHSEEFIYPIRTCATCLAQITQK